MKVLGSEVDDCQPLWMDDGISYNSLTGCKSVFLIWVFLSVVSMCLCDFQFSSKINVLVSMSV